MKLILKPPWKSLLDGNEDLTLIINFKFLPYTILQPCFFCHSKPRTMPFMRTRNKALRAFFLEFEMSVHLKSTTNNNKIVKKAYIFHVSPVMQ